MTILAQVYGLRLRGTEDIRYVGLTTKGFNTLGVLRRFTEHCKNANGTEKNLPIYDWMRKHGTDNIECVILENCSPEIVSEREIYWINELRTFIDWGEGGLNYTTGGERPAHSIESRRKISEACMAREPIGQDIKNKMSASQLERWNSLTEEERVLATNHLRTEEARERARLRAMADIESGKFDPSEMGRLRAQWTNHKRWHLERAKPNADCSLCQEASPEEFAVVEVTLWNQTEEGKKSCGDRANKLNHNRWHVKRNLVKEGCELCEQPNS